MDLKCNKKDSDLAFRWKTNKSIHVWIQVINVFWIIILERLQSIIHQDNMFDLSKTEFMNYHTLAWQLGTLSEQQKGYEYFQSSHSDHQL